MCGCNLKPKTKMKLNKIDFGRAAMKTVAVGGSAFGTRLLSQKVLPNMNPIVKNVALVFLGAMVPAVFAPKNNLAQDVGAGAIAAGAIGIGEQLTNNAGGSESVQGVGNNAYVIEEDYMQVSDNVGDSVGEEDTLTGVDDDVLV